MLQAVVAGLRPPSPRSRFELATTKGKPAVKRASGAAQNKFVQLKSSLFLKEALNKTRPKRFRMLRETPGSAAFGCYVRLRARHNFCTDHRTVLFDSLIDRAVGPFGDFSNTLMSAGDVPRTPGLSRSSSQLWGSPPPMCGPGKRQPPIPRMQLRTMLVSGGTLMGTRREDRVRSTKRLARDLSPAS
jgi:hypothetical protein